MKFTGGKTVKDPKTNLASRGLKKCMREVLKLQESVIIIFNLQKCETLAEIRKSLKYIDSERQKGALQNQILFHNLNLV